jgi:hypothetical protein
MNEAKVSLDVIKKDIEQHAKNLINGKQLEYKDYDWELHSMISKINMRFYMTPEEVSLKQSMVDILEELRCEDKYRDLKEDFVSYDELRIPWEVRNDIEKGKIKLSE